DRGRVRVDDDRPEPVLAQHLQRLAPGVVELARLPDHDRAGADQADRLEISSPRQPVPPTFPVVATRRAGRGPPRGGTAPTGHAAPGNRSPRPCRRRARPRTPPSPPSA